ncbi:L,D-transpeptidase family protein [Sphingomonas arantia]|uniref:L,D-transpeptidase family protein n=1 Tax=Sphingomonas arantia TaxID=1460676 RepID=A0ABW4U000_9SPHN
MTGGTGQASWKPVAYVALGIAVLGPVAWIAGISAREPVVPAAAPVRVAAAKPAVAPTPAAAPVDQGMVIKRVLDVPRPFTHGDYVWDEAGVPAGPMIVTVDLVAQTLSVFRGGYEIGTAVVMYGADERPTPTGIFPITQKDADHVSNLYDAPMPYMLRLTNDGVAIHGSDVEWGTVTHGCIGVPTAFAAKLFKVMKLGDRVIITRGEMLGQGQAIKAA